ncbi:MAG: hypothetical protein ABIT76_06100 [Chthoniobacterales bacterium]
MLEAKAWVGAVVGAIKFHVWVTPLLSIIAAFSLQAEDIRHPRIDGLSGTVGVGYDGTRLSSEAFNLSSEIEFGDTKTWISLSTDTNLSSFSDFRIRRDSYLSLKLGAALYRNNDTRFYLNATFALDPHSRYATQGMDLSPGLDFAWGLTDALWIGGGFGIDASTSPKISHKPIHPTADVFVTYLCAWLPNESDSISLNANAGADDSSGSSQTLSVNLSYTFNLTENLEATVGIGGNVISSIEPGGVHALSGLTWRF